MNINKIQTGSLVFDINPYKAPEILHGFGLVTRLIDKRYVEVCWLDSDFTEIVMIENLEVVNENRKPS
jgi:hypothetical protein